MRNKLIAGNWKMHLNASQASILVHRLEERIKSHRDVEVVLCPSTLVLQPLSVQLDRRKFKLGAQDAYHKDEGAFTGEVSATMLHDLVHYVILGHSERRYIFNETDDLISAKVAAVIRNKMSPILCVGETSGDRSANETDQVLHDQLMVDLRNLTSHDVKSIVVAYEPVWAIGTGNFAKPDQVKDAVRVIRHNIRELFGANTEKQVRVLYGGSVTPDNSKSYLEVEGVDGLLVGGASLNYQQFSKIVEITHDVAGGEK